MQIITIDHVLNRIKSRHDLKSDYMISKVFNISTQSISGWRNGRSLPDEKTCVILATAAGIDPDVLVLQMNAQRAKDESSKAIWMRMAERLHLAAHGMAAVFFSVLVATGFVATDARAASSADVHPPAAQGVKSLYIVSSGWALLFAALAWIASRFDRGFTPCFVPAE